MKNIRGKALIINGQAADVSGYTPDPSADLFYEVIRVIDGKYLFLDDHIERLQRSCSKQIPVLPDRSSIASSLKKLVQTSEIKFGNVKLIIYQESGQTNTACFYTSHFYPAAEDYHEGVCVKTFEFERPDPNIKKWNEHFRTRVNKFIREESIYEAVLVNEQGILTEGSRSNLFFISSGNTVYTAPLDLVLPGITRRYVVQICGEAGITIKEEALNLRQASQMSGCFISGTSPKVLPVKQLDDTLFPPGNPIIQKIGTTFNKLVMSSLT